jgi:hypothetical protein
MQIGGIGKVTEQMLHHVLGISTCQDMLQKADFLCALFSECSAGLYFNDSISCSFDCFKILVNYIVLNVFEFDFFQNSFFRLVLD